MKRVRRSRSKLDDQWFGKGRKVMVEVCMRHGINDVCTCNAFESPVGEVRYRKNSGDPGMIECEECHYLIWPLQYVYDCDNCGDPSLSTKYPLYKDEEFLCLNCQLEV